MAGEANSAAKGTPAAATTAAGSADLGTVARLGAQKSKYKARAKELEGQATTLKTENEQLKARLTELEAKADTSASAKRVLELEQQLRDRDHRAAFDRVARTKGVREEALADAWQLSGYKAEGEPDDDAIGALIDEQKGTRGYLFGESGTSAEATNQATTTPTASPIHKPAPGSGQGKSPVSKPAVLAPDDPRHSDVKFMMRNYEAISQAAADRVARGEI